MKLLCLNVSAFEETNNKLRQFFQKNAYDIICLQEVTRKVQSHAKDSYETKPIIDSQTPQLTNSFYSPNCIMESFVKPGFSAFGGQMDFGLYTKTLHRVKKAEQIYVQNNYAYISDWSNWPEEDYRSFQVVDIETDNKNNLRVINYHGIWTRDKLGTDLALQACEMIVNKATEKQYPTIICGDFNLFPETDAMKIFDSNFINLSNEHNIRSTRPPSNELDSEPRNVVDYIIVSKDIEVTNFGVLHEEVSDHLPLVLEFDLPKK
jgi:endonuclease/exonuclease/phosphatase family metal-dependent hydrolase